MIQADIHLMVTPRERWPLWRSVPEPALQYKNPDAAAIQAGIQPRRWQPVN